MFRRKPKKVVLSRDEHDVSRDDIDHDALKVLYRLNRNGHTACLVGGAVRDLLLGGKPKDFDVGTTARPNQVKKLFRNCFLVGRRFRLAHIRFGEKIIETGTFRKQPEPVDATNEEEASLYVRRDNAYGTPEEDAMRRDFTVNGIFYDIDEFRIIDYVGGLEDLKKRRIRAIGDPDVRFCEDPVRMIRAIRYSARLGFTIDRRTWKAVLKNHREILKASPARLFDELPKFFVFGSGTEAMRLMLKSGLLADLLPGVADYLARAKDKGKFFWSCLEALDKRHSKEDAPSNTVLYGVMSYPLFLEEIERHRGKAGVNHLVLAKEVVGSLIPGLPMPRKAFFKIAHMLNSQHRFENWDRGRFSKQHFVGQESFLDASVLHEIVMAAEGRQLPRRKPWLDLHKECVGESKGSENKSERPRRSRKRYKGKGRIGRRPRRQR